MSLFELRAITAAVESSGQKKAEAQVSRMIFSSIVSSQYICEYAERLWFRRGYTFEKRMPDNLIKVFASNSWCRHLINWYPYALRILDSRCSRLNLVSRFHWKLCSSHLAVCLQAVILTFIKLLITTNETRKLLNPAKLYSFAQYAFLSHGYSIQTRPRLQYMIVTYDGRYQNYVLLGCNLYSVNLFS